MEGTNQGSYDAFVRKYDGSGTILWTRQFGTTAPDFANGIATDSSGNVLIAGSTQGSLIPNLTNKGNYDAYVRKYDTNGNVLQTRQFGTTAFDVGSGVATDASGNVFIGGSTEGRLQSGVTNKGSSDAFIRKYTP